MKLFIYMTVLESPWKKTIWYHNINIIIFTMNRLQGTNIQQLHLSLWNIIRGIKSLIHSQIIVKLINDNKALTSKNLAFKSKGRPFDIWSYNRLFNISLIICYHHSLWGNCKKNYNHKNLTNFIWNDCKKTSNITDIKLLCDFHLNYKLLH